MKGEQESILTSIATYKRSNVRLKNRQKGRPDIKQRIADNLRQIAILQSQLSKQTNP